MWRAEGKWLPKTSRKSVSQSVFCGTSTYCVLNTVPPIEDDHGNSNSSHVKIFLPKKLLECLPKCSSLPKERHRWNTNEEIAAYLITFEKHEEWLTTSPKTRPQNGSMILYNRKKVKYRKDGYCWKKRKDGKTTREDHMKLKVQGVEEMCTPSSLPDPPAVNRSSLLTLQPPSYLPLTPGRGRTFSSHPTTSPSAGTFCRHKLPTLHSHWMTNY
ncbi:calmodulin-binding transcription activator 1 isoform X19 [Castor canadensis]|uniref:Calmodulin-binding transcription activator 1 isoform X19 n=1 Tax=Castor canadensis TaxID=51338 RepID=A0AC58N7D5_CASCN